MQESSFHPILRQTHIQVPHAVFNPFSLSLSHSQHPTALSRIAITNIAFANLHLHHPPNPIPTIHPLTNPTVVYLASLFIVALRMIVYSPYKLLGSHQLEDVTLVCDFCALTFPLGLHASFIRLTEPRGPSAARSRFHRPIHMRDLTQHTVPRLSFPPASLPSTSTSALTSARFGHRIDFL